MNKSHKGFTLIELLVVIAIIGILSAVVLASLTTARTKGKDAAIQSDLDSIKTQAALYASNNQSTYGTGVATEAADCSAGLFADPTVTSALAGIRNNTATPICVLLSDGANANGFIAAAPSQVNAGNYFCVDSSGLSTTTAVAPSDASTGCGD